MDEFKKDEILEEENEVAAETEATETIGDVEKSAENTAEEITEETVEDIAEEKSALETELEEIRDMFQKELDSAREGADSDMLIQELDDETIPEEEENLPKCECCGENPRSLDHGEDYPYCDSCRETMKRYPLRFSGVLTLLISIILVIGTTYFAVDSLESAISAADIVMNFESGYLMSGLQGGYSYLNSTEQSLVSKKVVKKMVEGYLTTGYYSDAANLVNTFYSESQLKLPWNSKNKKVIKEAAALQESYAAISNIIAPVIDGEKYDYDEVMEALEALKSADPKADNPEATIEKYNEVFIDYYKFVVMSVNEKSYEEQLAQLQEIDKIGEGYEWAYLANLGYTASMTGDEEVMNEALNRLAKINKEDSSPYLIKANYYRFLETPDPEKILEVCKEAEANLNSSDTSYKQYEAIAYLLKGEGELAFEAIEAAVSAGYTVQTCNLYALCGLYVGEDSAYNDMKSILNNSGYEISDLVTQYKNGKITIEEILADNGGDI